MRSLIIRNKRIKVIAHQRLNELDLWDDACLEFSEIDRSELLFSRPIQASLLQSLEFVEIFFKISGQWKRYKISTLVPIFEYSDRSIINRVSFSFDEKEQSDFDQSFRIARCC